MTDSHFLRPAVRGLVIDDDNDILMARLVYPHGVWWVLPGGGIEPGEDQRAALVRELEEEIGLVGAPIGAALWRRSHVFNIDSVAPDGRRYEGQQETVFVVRVARFMPTPSLSTEELRAENLHELRWWTLDDIERYDGSDFFAPQNVADLVREFVMNGAPTEPVEIFQR